MKSVYTFTLGCRTNQYDSAAIEETLKSSGFSRADNPESADIIIVHTCSVTGRADSKSLQAIRKLSRIPGKKRLIVSGCGPESDAKRFQEIKGVSHVFGVNAASSIAAYLTHDLASNVNPFPALINFKERTRAHLKIQDGCDAFCTYCIVPLLRGKPISRPFQDVIEQARILIDRGYSEIVITGIHVGRYFSQGKTLADVIEGMAGLTGDFRIRLSSIEPGEVSDRIINLVLGNEKVCNHLHVSLQSGSDEILKRMNRQYSAMDFFELIDRIRKQDPFCGLGTDVITGFPGESDLMFNETLELIRMSALNHGHVFPFSLRKGTTAENMDGKVDRSISLMRAGKLKETFALLKEKFMRSMIGHDFKVIFENNKAGFASNYIRVKAPKNMVSGKITSLIITDIESDTLIAE